jgi:hypothetical protein
VPVIIKLENVLSGFTCSSPPIYFWLLLEAIPSDERCALQVLKAISDHRQHLKPDSLQQLHVSHNLSKLLDEGEKLPESANLSEGSLIKDANLIRPVCFPSPDLHWASQ